jgi:hypothetical protein
LEFHCSGNSDRYTILNSVKLLLHLKLIKVDGSDIVPDDKNKVCCVNNLLHSLFNSLGIELNGRLVTPFEIHYHTKAIIEELLNYGSDATRTHVISNLFIPDTPGTDEKITAVAGNKGYESRLKFLNNGQTIELMPTCSILTKC